MPLYYDDGSLMHGGMYFELDTGLSVTARRRRARASCTRVEHYGKGAPPGAAQFTRTRPVPAVTGAFISCDRAWFEALGGFTEDYVFGHYEDADLCLKSLTRHARLAAGSSASGIWRARARCACHAHEGGSLVNRWLFSRALGSDDR